MSRAGDIKEEEEKYCQENFQSQDDANKEAVKIGAIVFFVGLVVIVLILAFAYRHTIIITYNKYNFVKSLQQSEPHLQI